MSSFQFEQIGVIRSPYKEKFAVPRQPGLVKSANGELHLIAPYNQADAVRGLEAFSHLWILFVFHQTMEGGWRPTVRPPRLGGNARMGVFATRSTFRPNPIGMSLVELKEVVCHKDSVILKLGSLDLVDGTPVVDIKPYLPLCRIASRCQCQLCAKCASGRDGGEFYRRGRKAAFDAGEALSAVNAVYPRSTGAGPTPGLS
ncbi:hypothetical protein HMPREF9349_05200 [Escherichia coli MS 79-10]|nr:hypothetical protein HMPREF9349_05200 [Escherichia coli MS 79-10]